MTAFKETPQHNYDIKSIIQENHTQLHIGVYKYICAAVAAARLCVDLSSAAIQQINEEPILSKFLVYIKRHPDSSSSTLILLGITAVLYCVLIAYREWLGSDRDCYLLSLR